MIDKTLISIISMVFAGVGLVGAITKYELPNARKATYGENLSTLKENIINNFITWFFSLYAMLGLFIQIIFGEILDSTERNYSTNFYFLALALGIFVMVLLIPTMKKLCKWVARDYWLPEIIQKARGNFELAKNIIEQSNDNESNKNSSENQKEDNTNQVVTIVDWLEELFEMKSDKQDLKSRLSFFEKTFK